MVEGDGPLLLEAEKVIIDRQKVKVAVDGAMCKGVVTMIGKRGRGRERVWWWKG